MTKRSPRWRGAGRSTCPSCGRPSSRATTRRRCRSCSTRSRWLEAHGERFDAICQLQPTSPLREPGEIEACIALLEDGAADAVMTVAAVPQEHNPHWVYFMDADGELRLSTGATTPPPRRQALPPAYHRDGSVYVTRRDVVMEQNSLYGSRVLGLVMSGSDCVNIDHLNDFAEAESILRRRAQSTAARDRGDVRILEKR